MQLIYATYQQGVFRPLDPVSLPEGCTVELHVGDSTSSTTKATEGQALRNGASKIETRLAELASQIPLEEWDTLPADLSDRIDLHLYGSDDK
jgi:predicted DNA-binding antitoxin AbrB/MazE fold protein